MFSNYPKKVIDNAMEGYILNKIYHKCKNDTGVKTAIKLINNEPLTEKFAHHIYSYLKRAKVYVGEKNRCGYISYQLWGGKEMLQWLEKKINKS